MESFASPFNSTEKIKLSETNVQEVTTLQTYLLLPKFRNDMQLEEQ